MNDCTYKNENGVFNYRVAGLLIHCGNLLIMTDENLPYYYLPGGRVQFNENSNDAIIREIKEELKIKIDNIKLIWVNENFFTEESSSEKYHEICFYYKVIINDENEITKNNEFVIVEENKKHRFIWVNVINIKKYKIYPLFLAEKINDDDSQIKHIVEYT
jgi:ADP-ribose pyrophosphatase YjhB (NUDIX family)